MRERKAAEIVEGEKCERCRRFKAQFLTEVKGAVTVKGRFCTRCNNALLRDYPASSSVHLVIYEQ